MPPRTQATAVPFCSATRTLRERESGKSYREECPALVQWVQPDELRRRKPSNLSRTCLDDGKRAELLHSPFSHGLACNVHLYLAHFMTYESNISELTLS